MTRLTQRIIRKIQRAQREVIFRARSAGFGSVKAVDGINIALYLEQVTKIYDPLTNPFWYYKTLVGELLRVEKLRVVPLCDLLTAPLNGERIISLRHDVDADPLTALRCARYLAFSGIPGSFYLLHTALYYGQFVQNIFVRNPRLPEWITAFLVTGCELGIHNDCMNIYLNHGLDGAQALIQEILWLREHGANIQGTVAHNSGPAYGAENFEIFSGRVLWKRSVRTRQGKRIPLGTLSEADLGLKYEGGYAKPKPRVDVTAASRFFGDLDSASVRSKAWMEQYLLNNPAQDYLTDYEFWLIGSNQWVVAGKWEGVPLFEWIVSIDRVVSLVKELPLRSRSVFVIHPEYVRGHSSETDWPPCR